MGQTRLHLVHDRTHGPAFDARGHRHHGLEIFLIQFGLPGLGADSGHPGQRKVMTVRGKDGQRPHTGHVVPNGAGAVPATDDLLPLRDTAGHPTLHKGLQLRRNLCRCHTFQGCFDGIDANVHGVAGNGDPIEDLGYAGDAMDSPRQCGRP